MAQTAAVVNYRLIFAPRWQRQVLTGLPFGVFMGLVQHFWSGAPVGVAAGLGAVAGVIFGSLFGWFLHRQTKPLRDRLGGTMPSRQVRKAVLRGPLPSDPADRQAVATLVTFNLAQLERNRRTNQIAFGAMVLGGLLLALARSYGALLAVVGVFNLVQSAWTLRRLRSRQAQLAGR